MRVCVCALDNRPLTHVESERERQCADTQLTQQLIFFSVKEIIFNLGPILRFSRLLCLTSDSVNENPVIIYAFLPTNSDSKYMA